MKSLFKGKYPLMIKKIAFGLLSLGVAGMLIFINTSSAAPTPQSFDAAADPGANPDASVNGEGPATVDAWTTVSSFGGAGSLLGGGLSDGTYTNDNTWQIFTVTGQDSQIYSKHFLDPPLETGNSISLNFANSSIATGGSVGISLKDSSNVNIAQFLFLGGGTNYQQNSGGANTSTGHGFEFQDLMNITWVIGGFGSYIATLSDPGTNVVEATWSGTLGGNGVASGIEVFNNNGGNSSDVFYDDLVVAIPEVSPAWSFGAPAILGALFFARRRRAKA